MTRLAFRVGVPLLVVLATAGIVEVGLRFAGPNWLRARMAAMAAGSVVVGETVNTASFGEWRDGAFVRFRPGAWFALIDPEFHTTVHVTDQGTRVTGTEAGGAARVGGGGAGERLLGKKLHVGVGGDGRALSHVQAGLGQLDGAVVLRGEASGGLGQGQIAGIHIRRTQP